jgi:hypothetical protein
MHRLRIELGGESNDLIARHMTRAERPEVAGREVFECQGHTVDRWWDARLWPLFAAITSLPAAVGFNPVACHVRRRSLPRATSTDIAPDGKSMRSRYDRRTTMFEFRDLFQWDRFITPGIIKTFYWLVIGLVILFGISGIFSGLAAMAVSPFAGVIVVLYSLAGIVVGIIFSRIAAEFVLIIFRINEHLGAIRDQGLHR